MNLLYVFNTYQVKISKYLFLFLLITLPYSINFSNIVLVGFCAFAILRIGFFKDLYKIYSNIIFCSFFLLFLSILLSVSYSENIKAGLFQVEKSLSLILIPLAVFPLKNYIDKSFIQRCLLIFAFGVTIAMIWLYINLITLFSSSPDTTIVSFFREQAVNYVELHPSYLSMYIVFSLLVLMDLLFFTKSKYTKVLLIANIVFLLGSLALTGARMGLIAFIFSSFSWGIFKLSTQKNKLKFIFSALILVPAMLFAAIHVPAVEQRLLEIKNTPLEPPLGIHFNSVNLRVAQTLCSLEIIADNWWLGVGAGDVQGELNDCYKGHGWSPALYDRNYNAHNQYFQLWLTSGLPGVMLFIGILLVSFYWGVKKSLPVNVAFIVLFATACITESMLEKNKGIVFFMTFAVLFSLQYLKINPRKLKFFEKNKSESLLRKEQV